MNRGLSDLSTVAAVAPLLGIFATCIGIVQSFRGIVGDRTSIMAALVWSLTLALWPAALGLLIGVLAIQIRRWILQRAQETAWRLAAASEELAQFLASSAITQGELASPAAPGVQSTTLPIQSAPRFPKASAAVTIAALAGACALQPSDLWFVIFAFLLSLFPAQALARAVFQHRGGVFPIAALMSCFWCAIAG